MTWRGGGASDAGARNRLSGASEEISREPSSQHATRGFVGTATFRTRSGGLSGREASSRRHVLAAYLSGRLGEERGGFAEHLCRLGPHGGRFGNVRLVSSKGNKITTDARARSRFPTAFATARQLTSPERAERGARDDACDEKGRARSCVHRTTTREADVETLLFEGKKHYSRVIRWRRRAEHEMVVK